MSAKKIHAVMVLLFVGVVTFVAFRAWKGQEKLPFDPLSRYHSRNPEMKIPVLEPTEATTLVMDVVLALVFVVCAVTDWRSERPTLVGADRKSVVLVTALVSSRLLLSVVLAATEFEQGRRFDSCEDRSSTNVSGGYVGFLIGDFVLHLVALYFLLRWRYDAVENRDNSKSKPALSYSTESQFVALDQILWVYVGFALVLTVSRPTQLVFALWESACSKMDDSQIIMLLSTYLLLALTVWLLRSTANGSSSNSALMLAVIPVVVIIVQPAYASQKSFSNVSKTILGILLYCSVLSNAVQKPAQNS